MQKSSETPYAVRLHCFFPWQTRDGIESRLRSMGDLSGKVVLHHAPQDTSQVRGLRNRNLKAWQQQYPEASFCFIPDGKTRGEVCIAYGSLWYTIHNDRYDG